MASKAQTAKYDCYHNALPDEPMFILLARDPAAPFLVEQWAEGRANAITAGERPMSDTAMVDEAMQCAADMRAWREKNDGVWRKPIAA